MASSLTRFAATLSRLCLGGSVLLTATPTRSQGTLADYERADSLRQRTRGKVAGLRLKAVWSADERELIFKRVLSGDEYEITRLELATGRRTPAFDHDALAKLIAGETGITCSETRLPVRTFSRQDDGSLWLLVHAGDEARVARIDRDGDATFADLAAPHPFALTPMPPSREQRSRDNGPDVNVLFVNRSDTTIQLSWIDRGKQRKKYGEIAPGATRSQHTFPGHVWLATDAAGLELTVFVASEDDSVAVVTGLTPEPPKEPNDPGAAVEPDKERPAKGGPGQSPDGRWRAFIRDHNVFVRQGEKGAEVQLSTDGSEDDTYGGTFHWSPDSRHLVVSRTKQAEDRLVYFVESSPKDQVQPKLHNHNYRKAGDEIPLSTPCLFDVTGKRQVPVDDSLFPNPWAISHHHWTADSSRFLFVYNQRGHQVLRLISIDAETGEASCVVDETSKTFINYSNKLFVHHLDSAGEVIWMSERDGWNHLYLIDQRTGELKRQITKGEWVVRDVQRVDEERRRVTLQVLGVHPGQDPYYAHWARANLDGSELTILTKGNGTHSIELSPKGGYVVDTYSRVDLPPVKELRRSSDGRLVAELARADVSALRETGWQPPEPFAAKGRDGETDIHGVLYRPTTFDPAGKYPVVEAIYAGPHGHHAPKAFADFRDPQALAELGFIVVQIDGMGTNWRSKAFHDVCWKDLGDAGFPDRIAWLRAAARRYPYMDLERVGIYGGSAGGQNAVRALIDHHEVYKVAVADCGCHDNRMDKIWWNEAWMGWPVDKEAYDRSSNVVQAHRLKGHLLLTVGEMDRNVDPASTLQLVDALIKADKDFDLIVFPGKGHGAGGSAYGKRRMYDFFVRHLHGAEPRGAETPD